AYPGWPEAINELCSACGVQCLALSEVELADNLLDKAEECKNTNQKAYYTKLAELFGHPIVEERRAFRLLMNLPFKAYVTTNFDPLLAEAAKTKGNYISYSYPDLPVSRLGESSPSVFHIHGLARQDDQPKGDNLVLARSDFDKAYNGIVRSFLDQLLTYHDILFIGCRLKEPVMMDVFRRMHEFHGQIYDKRPERPVPERYALLSLCYKKEKIKYSIGESELTRDENEERQEDNRFLAMKITPKRYGPYDPYRHWEVEQILDYLCKFADEFKA
ncbi:unnamed protein product, partial [marine sediment metagenome]